MKCAQFIKEIGRGKQGARSLTREHAQALWSAVLAGEVSDLELGALLLSMRIKGESVEELEGFLDATHLSMAPLDGANAAPVVIPSYNGARQLPNLVALLAALLAREGVPVMVHGVVDDPMADARKHGPRVTTAQVFAALDLPIAATVQSRAADWALAQSRAAPLFVPIHVLHPTLSNVLSLRAVLGVRNSAHTIAKLIQPFSTPALRIASYTHPEYRDLLDRLFVRTRADALLMRATEGEAAANVRRGQRIDGYDAGVARLVVDAQSIALPNADLPEDRDAAVTARWIHEVLRGERPVPAQLQLQTDAVLEARARMLRRLSSGVAA